MKTNQRNVSIRFYRSCHVNECEIERSHTAHIYRKLTEASIGRLQDLIDDNRIETEVNFKFYTEIEFSLDKEEPEAGEDPSGCCPTCGDVLYDPNESQCGKCRRSAACDEEEWPL